MKSGNSNAVYIYPSDKANSKQVERPYSKQVERPYSKTSENTYSDNSTFSLQGNKKEALYPDGTSKPRVFMMALSIAFILLFAYLAHISYEMIHYSEDLHDMGVCSLALFGILIGLNLVILLRAIVKRPKTQYSDTGKKK